MRWSYQFRYNFYEKVMNIFTHFHGPIWPWALRKQERLQKREQASGRPWRMNSSERV